MLKITNARSGLPSWINPFQVVSVSRQTILDLNGPVPNAPVWTEVELTNGNPLQVIEDADKLAAEIGKLLNAF